MDSRGLRLDLHLSLKSELTSVRTTIDELQTEVHEQKRKVSEYRELAEEANNNIEEAKSYEGGSYQEVTEALMYLETVDIP